MTYYYDAVIFDCDGVLVDSEVLSTKVSQRILADLGWDADLETLLELFVGCSSEFYYEEIERRLGRSLEPGWDAPYSGWLDKALEEELEAIPGIAEALGRITLPTAVASNSSHRRIRSSLALVGLLEVFDGRISSAEDVAAGKPAPDVYLHAAELLNVRPERCIAIDDSRFGVESAHRAGMSVLAYAGSPFAGPLPEGERIFRFDDMAALPALVERLVTDGTLAE